MRLRILAAFSMTLGILAATIVSAGPVSAAPAEWVMPNVKGMVLQKAMQAVSQVAAPTELKFKMLDNRNVQDILNYTNWSVCYTWPVAGKPISQKTKAVSLYVKRFNQKSCWS
ncbi:hypothetical protein NGTWS1803_28610 [Mycolicibacterium cyprinidarum]|nr:hypothetical protein NGTWS1803_28610 [Mycolicibacterium sp. NGTWS1803]